MKYDSVVIGSGVSGLSASIVLARHGHKVAIVEQWDTPSPLLRRFERNGIWCNPGLHYVGGLHPDGALSVLFRYLEVDAYLTPVSYDNDGFDEIRCPNGMTIALPTGLKRVQEVLTAHFPESREAISTYIQTIVSTIKTTPFLNFDLPYDQLNKIENISESFGDFMTKSGAEDKLTRVLGSYGHCIYGSPTFEVPLFTHCAVMGMFYQSAHTFEHGGDDLQSAFNRVADDLNIDILCGRRVTDLVVSDDRAYKAVQFSDGECLESAHCVSTIHPSLLTDLLPADALRPVLRKKLKRLSNTFSPIIIYLDIDRELLPDPPRNYFYIDPDSHLEKDLILVNGHVSNSEKNKTATCLITHADRPLPTWEKYVVNDPEYIDYKEEQTKKNFLRALSLWPELKGRCRLIESATPHTLKRYNGSVDGAIYGVKQTIHQLPLRAATRIQGLVMAGQSTLIPGIMGSVVSGIIAASHIIEKSKIWNEIRKCRLEM